MLSMKTLGIRQETETESATTLPANEGADKLLSKLQQSGYTELRKIEVSFEANVATMFGVVYSFYAKQLAQEIAKRTFPDAVVDNRITVVSTTRQR